MELGIELTIIALVYGLLIELFVMAKPRRKPLTEMRAKEILKGMKI
jgi:hypothetical protein